MDYLKMDKDILNAIYPFSSKFGQHKTVIELTKEHFPNLNRETQRSISRYIEKTRSEIINYFFERYDHKENGENNSLQKNGYEWIEQTYPWMNEDNIQSSVGEGMYFGWHG